MVVGRQAEVALLVELLDEGRPGVVLGEAGVGKTTLVRAAAEHEGKDLVEAGALATLSWLPFLPLRRAFGHDFEGDAAYVAATVEAELGAAVLFLDDLQWADRQTASLLPLLARRVSLVAALRRGDPETSTALEAATAAGLELLPLSPLPDADAVVLARSLHPGLSETATRRLVERSGGNPFLLEQLAATGEPSDSLRLTVSARLRGLTPAGRDAMAALALLGRPAPDRLLGPGAEEIVAAGLATANGEVAIRHALLAEATIEMLPAEKQRRIHSRLAAALDDLGEAARHHAAAGERDLAHERALLAAERATTPGERAAHLGVAAANTEGAQGKSLRIEAGQALLDVGEYAAALDVVEPIRSNDPNVAARLALLRSRIHYGRVQVDDARRELGAAIVAGATDLGLRIRIDAHRARMALRDGQHLAALSIAEKGVQRAEAAAAEGPEVAEIYSMLGLSRTEVGERGAIEAHQDALAAARRANAVEFGIVNNLLLDLLREGELAAADEAALEAVERARSQRLFIRERRFRGWHAGIAWHLGYPGTAAAEAEAVLAEVITTMDVELVEPYWWLAMTDLGKGETVRAFVEERVANAPQDDDGVGEALWVLAELELAAGRPAAADSVAASYLDRFDQAATFIGVVRAWSRFEQGMRPERLSRATFRLVEGGPVEVDGVVALSTGDAAGAALLFDRAASLWDGRHLRGAYRCRWAAAESLRRTGQIEEARARLLLIESEVEHRELNVLLRKIRRSLRLAGVRRAAERTKVGALTGREAEVLVLVAEGLTNDEIARRLGVGRPTIVRLIRSAQQKLGARSRAQAAALAAGR